MAVIKLISGALLVAALGLPILDTWKTLLLAAGALALVFGESRSSWRRLAAAAAVAAALLAARATLPRGDIAEGHNAFLVIDEGEALQRGLPPDVFPSWKAQFDALYPPDPPPYDERSQWRAAGVPKTLFTTSADALWRRPKYTRQVDAIEFSSLADFRGGFANEVQYNFWTGELLREEMPFFAMYELTSASVGSRLAWQGQAFWQRADGGYEEVVHSAPAAREITEQDIGRRVYAVFFPKRDGQLLFRLEPSSTLRVAKVLDALFTIGGVCLVVGLTTRPRWTSYGRAVAIFATGYAVMMAFVAVSAGKYVGRAYPPQGGGDDGMVHDGWGRIMAMLAARGEILEALMGTERVYWFTPGTRYVRMVEKLVFGDTNHLFALALPCLLVVVFYLVRHFVGTRLALGITLLTCLAPVGNLSFLQYIANAKLGYGETIGVGLYLLALALMLRTEPYWGGTRRNVALATVAGASLAASMFIRPNFAFAVVWLGAAYAFSAWRRKDAASVLAVAVGLGLALWMPFHNVYYGGEFRLISRSGATISVPIGVSDYGAAAIDAFRGRFDTNAVGIISTQLRGWLWSPGLLVRPQLAPLAWVAHGIKLLALAIAIWVAVRWLAGRCSEGSDLGVVAVAAICAHVPMLFIFTTHYRYAMLGWDLALVVAIVWVVRQRSAAASPRRDFSTV
jgi:hypothetical protein